MQKTQQTCTKCGRPIASLTGKLCIMHRKMAQIAASRKAARTRAKMKASRKHP